MKTTILTSALILLLSAANASVSVDSTGSNNTKENNDYVWVIKSEDNMIRFNVANPMHEEIVLKIYNEDNVKVFQESAKDVDAVKVNCDLTIAGKGDYTCIIKRRG